MFSKEDLSENDDRGGLEEWESVMLKALGTKKDPNHQHDKNPERYPIGI